MRPLTDSSYLGR